MASLFALSRFNSTRRHGMWLGLLSLVLAGQPRTVLAEGPPLAEDMSSARAESEAEVGHEACPLIFGDGDIRRANRQARRRALKLIDESPHLILLEQTGDWEAPRPMAFSGLEVISTETNRPQRHRQVVVELDDSLRELGCPEGRYVVHVDDALGTHARVLAVLDQVVLVEAENQLGYLATEDARPPKFSMAWVSTWPVNPYLRRPSSPLVVRPPPRRR